MQIHIALYAWKPSAKSDDIRHALAAIEALTENIPGIMSIQTGFNTSDYSDGYTHVILVRGQDAAAIQAYRAHPGHTEAAQIIEALEEKSVGVDFSTN
jgi:heme-degrading monooxygenase HmoA